MSIRIGLYGSVEGFENQWIVIAVSNYIALVVFIVLTIMGFFNAEIWT